MIGSAASLYSPMPQAPLSPLTKAPAGLVHEFPANDATPRIVPWPKTADDLPGGHVLLVEDDAATALEVQQLLGESGYRVVGPAASAEEAQRLLDRGRRPIVCALVGASVPGAAAIADSLVARDIPVVWIAPASTDAFAWDKREEPMVRWPFARADLIATIERCGTRGSPHRPYPVPPPQPVWPRVFPSL